MKLYQFTAENSTVVRVDAIAPFCFRVRVQNANGTFQDGWLNRYGILEADLPETDVANADFSVLETADSVTLSLPKATLTLQKADGRFTLADTAGNTRLQTVNAPFGSTEAGFGAVFPLDAKEKLYGLGDTSRDNLNRRGGLYHIWVKNVACYAPTPFVMSTGGWAVFVNTTHRHYFDLGHTKSDEWRFGGQTGYFDVYLIAGDSLPQLLDYGTRLMGRPALLPLYAYGLTFVCNQQVNAREMLEDCHGFRAHDVPCDTVGLEPGWMAKHYDFSTEKSWHPERFWIPFWDESGPSTFVSAAKRLGFRMSLWLCTEYDLTYEEERQAVLRGADARKAIEASDQKAGVYHPDDVIQDEHFGHGAIRFDRITKPSEPWFQHLEKFVTQGVKAFKLDGANTVNEHPDRLYGNGCTDAEMHNLYPTLAAKQVSEGFTAQTNGKRAFVYTSGAYAGIARYAAVWAGDTGGGPRSLISLLNHALSGQVNTGVDANVYDAAGIHAGFLQPWAQINSWYEYLQPWLLGNPLEETVRFYAKLRYRLLPYIYCTAHQAYRTGMPILRPMPLAFPQMPEADDLTTQYLLGDSLLIGSFTDTLVLPDGTWYDFWTGERHIGGQTITQTAFLPHVGGFLFVRAGAILPLWSDGTNSTPSENALQKGITAFPLSLRVYPPEPGQISQFTLYTDDGETTEYRNGAVATTVLTLQQDTTASEPTLVLTVKDREGTYARMPNVLPSLSVEEATGQFVMRIA